MGEILNVFGVFLAVYTYLESLSYNEINECLELKSSTHKEDNVSKIKRVKELLRDKHNLLCFITIALAAIMLPDSISVVRNSIGYIMDGNAKYDVISAAIILLNSVFIYLATRNIRNAISLRAKIKEFTA